MSNIAKILMLIMMLAHSGIIYPQTFIVDSVTPVYPDDCYNVVLRDANGMEYTYSAEDGDIEPGDMMSAIMYYAGTPDSVLDDEVLFVRYTGFCGRMAKENPDSVLEFVHR